MFSKPIPFSIPVPIYNWPIKLPRICSKWPCRTVGVMNLHTYQFYLIFLTSDHPHEIPLASGAKNAELSRPYTEQVIMNITNSIIVTITMNYLIDIFGQTQNPRD